MKYWIKKRYFIMFLTMFFLISSGLTEEKLLKSLINIGIQRNPKLIAKKEEIVLAERQIWVAKRSYFPNLYFQLRWQDGYSGNPSSSGTYSFKGEDRFIKIYQPIYDGGRISATNKYYLSNYEATKISYTKLKEDLVSKIKIAYYEYLSALYSFKETEKLVSDIEQYYKRLESEFEAKAISEIDLEEGRIFKIKVLNMYDKAKNSLMIYRDRLSVLVGVKNIEDIISEIHFEIFNVVPKSINFDFGNLKSLLLINNPDLNKIRRDIEMAQEKKKIVMGKSKPKLYFEGSWGESGEAFTDIPLETAKVYSGALKLSWLFGGSTFEGANQQDRANPSPILDPQVRTFNRTTDLKLGVVDDMKFFVESKEAEVLRLSSKAEYDEAEKTLLLELEKNYIDYYNSLLDADVNEKDLKFKKWKLDVLKKKHSLYEISTVEVMNGIYQVSESVLNYSKAVLQNYVSVSEMEKLVNIDLR